MSRRILVVDDERAIREHLKLLLERDGFEVDLAETGRAALAKARSGPYGLLITDLRLPDMGGLELLSSLRAENRPFGVLILTGYGDTTVALDAMRAGADEFLTKPFEPDRVRFLVDRIFERRRLIDELDGLKRRMHEDFSFHGLVSKSAKMRRVFDLIARVGPLGSTVLIQGETGTGKELVAQALHASSLRRDGPWIALNCAALAESLLESELFGHERGAFTGADRRKLGKFEQAHKGTLFLDEIGDISPTTQAKLLRVLQSGTFQRLGGQETIRSDCRMLVSTTKVLDQEVKEKRFRADLYYRLNVIRIDLPPLRERPEDIPLLAAFFLERLKAKSMPPVTDIHHEAMQALLDHSWPGNVRELENAIKAAVAMADGSIIGREVLPARIAPSSGAGRRAAASMSIARCMI